jgi:hypothetical protein
MPKEQTICFDIVKTVISLSRRKTHFFMLMMMMMTMMMMMMLAAITMLWQQTRAIWFLLFRPFNSTSLSSSPRQTVTGWLSTTATVNPVNCLPDWVASTNQHRLASRPLNNSCSYDLPPMLTTASAVFAPCSRPFRHQRHRIRCGTVLFSWAHFSNKSVSGECDLNAQSGSARDSVWVQLLSPDDGW